MQIPIRTLKYLILPNGNKPFLDWLDTISDSRTLEIVFARLARMRFGNLGNYKILGDKLCEARIHFGPGFRLYFGMQDQSVIVLIYGGRKDSQEKDIKKAKQ